MSVYGDRGLFDEPLCTRERRVLNAISFLFANRLAASIRRLFDRIDQAVQFDRGLKIRLAAVAGLDSLGEQRVHLTDIGGFAGWRTGRGDGEALWHRQQRERVVAFRPVQENLAQLRRVLAAYDQRAVA